LFIYTKTQKIKWWGHLNRMEDTKLVKITDWNPPRNKNQRTAGEMK